MWVCVCVCLAVCVFASPLVNVGHVWQRKMNRLESNLSVCQTANIFFCLCKTPKIIKRLLSSEVRPYRHDSKLSTSFFLQTRRKVFFFFHSHVELTGVKMALERLKWLGIHSHLLFLSLLVLLWVAWGFNQEVFSPLAAFVFPFSSDNKPWMSK